MKRYLDQWKIIEGSLTEKRISEIPDCLEKDHLFQIRKMLEKENFDPDEFIVDEYPSTGVYCFNNISKGTFFIIQEVNNKLVPYYTTWEMDKNGVNTFPCESIKQSIELIEM